MAKQQPERRFTLLYDKVCRQDILQEAWQRVKSNKGAAGVDDVDIDEIREYGEVRFLGEIEQELRDGSYRVSLVRRVHIPKARTAGKDSAVGHSDGDFIMHVPPIALRMSSESCMSCAPSLGASVRLFR